MIYKKYKNHTCVFWHHIKFDNKLSELEVIFSEIKIISDTYCNLMHIFQKKYKNYFKLIKFTLEMEHNMLEKNFMRFMINDILSSEDYTLEGIALYTDTPLDVVTELASGVQTNPSASLFLKIIALHQSVRPQLYKDIMDKFNPEDPDSTE